MNSTKQIARIAGLVYLFMAITGAFGVLYIPSTLIVPGSATATANNILGSEMLFRVGIVSELVAAVVFIFVVMVLYRLFSAVNRTHASLMGILALLSFPLPLLTVLTDTSPPPPFPPATFP